MTDMKWKCYISSRLFALEPGGGGVEVCDSVFTSPIDLSLVINVYK